MTRIRRWRHTLAHLCGTYRAVANYRYLHGSHVGGWSCLDCPRFKPFGED